LPSFAKHIRPRGVLLCRAEESRKPARPFLSNEQCAMLEGRPPQAIR
jgi:hypothetical protein